MRRPLIILITGFVFILLLSSFSHASDNPMADFYNGLADIIEGNMNNPDTCLARAEIYIKTNIGRLQAAAAKGKAMSQANAQDYKDMTAEDMQAAMAEAEKAMSDPKVAEAMNVSMEAMDRFTEALDNFNSRHPQESEKLMDLLDEYSSPDF